MQGEEEGSHYQVLDSLNRKKRGEIRKNKNVLPGAPLKEKKGGDANEQMSHGPVKVIESARRERLKNGQKLTRNWDWVHFFWRRKAQSSVSLG